MTPLLAETVAKLEANLPGANFHIDLDGTPTLSGKAVIIAEVFDPRVKEIEAEYLRRAAENS